MVMPLTYLATAARKVRSLKLPLLVLALSALLAFLFTIITKPDASTAPSAAGTARMRLLQEEHMLIADDTRARLEADRVAAERSRAEMRVSVVAEAPAPAAVLPPARPVRPSQVAVVSPAPKDVAASPPLPLQAAMAPAPQPRQAPIMQRAQAVLATVQRIPHWVGVGVREAADWAIIGPVQTIGRLPERRFL
jgi:hypothetical protein